MNHTPRFQITHSRILLTTLLAMCAFAANSLLCRIALKGTSIDATSFTTIRLISGAVVLWLIVRMGNRSPVRSDNWLSGLALFAYAAAFSYAYINLSAGTGALLLFGAVQATMIGYGLWSGERLNLQQTLGLLLALSGLVGLMLPGVSAPSMKGSLLMLCAGVAWGIYSLRGRGAINPTAVTAGNFLSALPFAIGLSILQLPEMTLDIAGIGYAAASGALASGVGYVIWYTALDGLTATHAATVQLSVPVIAAIGGITFLGEPLTLRFVIASVTILGGVAWVILAQQRAAR